MIKVKKVTLKNIMMVLLSYVAIAIILFIGLSYYFVGSIHVGFPNYSNTEKIDNQQIIDGLYNFNLDGEKIVSTDKDAWIGLYTDVSKHIGSITVKINTDSIYKSQISSAFNNNYDGLEIEYVDIVQGKNKVDIGRDGIGYIQLNLTDNADEEISIDYIEFNYVSDNKVDFWQWYTIFIIVITGIYGFIYVTKIPRKEKIDILFKIFIVSIFAYIIISIGIYGYIKIPHRTNNINIISASQLNGGNNNYTVKDNIYTSSTDFPWFHIEFEKLINDTYLNINVSELELDDICTLSTPSRIYYVIDGQFTEDKSIVVKLHNGNNIIKLPNEDINSLRLDLARKKNTSFRINSIYLNDGFSGGKLMMCLAFAIGVILAGMYALHRYHIGYKDKILNKLNKFGVGTREVFSELKCSIVKFLKQHWIVVLSTSIVSMASYGILCNYYTIYVDEERAFMQQTAETAWLNQGRFGNFIIEKLFFVNGTYTPYVGDFVAVILLMVSSIFVCMLFEKTLNEKKAKNISLCILSAIYCTVPYVCGGYMIVGIFNLQLGVGLCLTALSAYMIIDKKSNKTQFIISCILLTIAVSIYQAFIPFFITIVVMYYLIKLLACNEKILEKEIIKHIGINATVCIAATVLYWVINKVITYFYGGTGYYEDNFIGWNSGDSLKNIFKNMYENIVNIYRGSSEVLYGGKVIIITMILFVIYVIYKIVTKQYNRIMIAFLAICSILAPFSISILLGGGIFAGRTSIGLLVVFGVTWFIVIEKCDRVNILKNVVVFLALYSVFFQLQYINMFFLSDYKRFEMDKIAATQVVDEIRDKNNGNYSLPVVFVGAYYYEDNNLIMPYEQAGSYWCVDAGALARIVRFMQSEGYSIKLPSRDQIVDSKNHYDNMAAWPSKDSVKVVNNEYVIVKLSQPTDAWEEVYINIGVNY